LITTNQTMFAARLRISRIGGNPITSGSRVTPLQMRVLRFVWRRHLGRKVVGRSFIAAGEMCRSYRSLWRTDSGIQHLHTIGD